MKTLLKIVLRYFLLITLFMGFNACNNMDRSHTLAMDREEILQNIQVPTISDYTINIKDFGAIGDSIHNCKKAFDEAMADAEKHGGARIIIPEGTFFIGGPIHLISNVCLDFQNGSVIKFSNIPSNYLPVVKTSWEGTFLYNYSPYIYGYDLNNIVIKGNGTIYGNNSGSFKDWYGKQEESQTRSRKMNNDQVPIEERIFGEGYFLRPQLIQLFNCKNIFIDGVTIKESSFWGLHILKGENVIIQNLTLDLPHRNNDGIVLEYAKNVLVQKITFIHGYDNICIKSGRDADGRKENIPSKNIIVKDCKLTGQNGISLGSEMSGGIEKVIIEDCTYNGHLERGIFIKTNPNRGGYIKDIYMNNLHFGEVEECMNISSFYKGEGSEFVSDIHDIYLENIVCEKANMAGIVIHGFPQKPVTNIKFKNIRIKNARMGLNLLFAEKIIFSNVTIGSIIDTTRRITY